MTIWNNPKYAVLFTAKNLVKEFGEAEYALTGREPDLDDAAPGTRKMVMTTTTAIYTFDFTDVENPEVRIIPNPAFAGAVVKMSPTPCYQAISPQDNPPMV